MYRNENNAFTEIPVLLPAVSNCWTNIGDYDNDGDQDVFIMGDVGGWPVSAICKNEDGFFFEMDSTGIMPLSGGSASWCDYDKDQDLDILVTGFDLYLEPKTYIFRNDGDMVFTNIWPGLAGAALGTAAWADYDNDGDADILLTGQNAACGSLSSLVYRNDGNDNFTDINAPLDGAERGSADWGDYDNDGDLDIIISGFNGSGLASTKLYRNTNGSNSFTMSGAPAAPADLHNVATDHSVQLSWNKSLDNNTPENGITYNLRVGTYSGGQNVLSASVDATGFLLLPQSGNMGNDTTWLLHLPDGNYFWSVQALDHSFGYSSFAEEQQFTLMNVGIPATIKNDGFNVSPNPFSSILEISTSRFSKINICNSVGTKIFEDEYTGVNKINTSIWTPGIYYLTVSDGKQKFSAIILKK
ncbi:MAG: T9SS type A sorting domain-containing protein [Bacteroidales bacterium]|nr:T9SS type A sorting domain-containing protein [Bacteroidales bacterium]